MSESVCLSEDVAILLGTWLIMKLCMYVGYHTANNVSNFGGDAVTQLIFLNVLKNVISFTGMALHSRDVVTVSAAVATRSRADCSSREGHTSLSTTLV